MHGAGAQCAHFIVRRERRHDAEEQSGEQRIQRHPAAQQQCAEGQQAMVEVILNRRLSGKFPETLKEMIYGEKGLSTEERLNEAKLSQWAYLAVERAIYGPYILEKNVTEFSYSCHK